MSTPIGPEEEQSRVKIRKADRKLRLAQAKEEYARLQVELAVARIAVIETEESEDDTETLENSEIETPGIIRVCETPTQTQCLSLTDKHTQTEETNETTDDTMCELLQFKVIINMPVYTENDFVGKFINELMSYYKEKSDTTREVTITAEELETLHAKENENGISFRQFLQLLNRPNLTNATQTGTEDIRLYANDVVSALKLVLVDIDTVADILDAPLTRKLCEKLPASLQQSFLNFIATDTKEESQLRKFVYFCEHLVDLPPLPGGANVRIIEESTPANSASQREKTRRSKKSRGRKNY